MDAYRTPDDELLHRAEAVLCGPAPKNLAASTLEEYRRVAKRLIVTAQAAGREWDGIERLTDTKSTHYLQRAVWCRVCRYEVEASLNGLRTGKLSRSEALSRLRDWVPQAEKYRPKTKDAPDPKMGQPGAWLQAVSKDGRTPSASRSKKGPVRDMPEDWLRELWQIAVAKRYRHLDTLAVLLCVGCRPAEACRGIAVRITPEAHLQFAVCGAKVTEDNGQPWRLLTVAIGDDPAALHLESLCAAQPGERIRVRPALTPDALSTSIAEIAGDKWGRRISCYDIRHQRAGDAKLTFAGDLEKVAAWLGHAAATTLRFYTRLPRSSSCRGPLPIDAAAPRPVRRRTRLLDFDLDAENTF